MFKHTLLACSTAGLLNSCQCAANPAMRAHGCNCRGMSATLHQLAAVLSAGVYQTAIESTAKPVSTSNVS